MTTAMLTAKDQTAQYAAVARQPEDLIKVRVIPANRKSGTRAKRIVATYPYCDEGGTLLFQVARYEPKDFRQRRPEEQRWVWGLSDSEYWQGKNGDWYSVSKKMPVGALRKHFPEVRRVLYRLPELLKANPEAPVFIVEGEKDVDNLWALGLIATCNPGGAGKWSNLSDDSALHRRRVVVIPDKDEPGRRHAQDVAWRLQGKAAEVKVLELPGTGKDVSDWISAHNGADKAAIRAELLLLVETAPLWQPSERPQEASDGAALNGEHGTTVLEGERATTLTSLAGTMRRRGMTQKAIEAALLAENSARCSPPLPDAKVRGIAVSVARYPPTESRHFPPSDSGNCELFTMMFGDKLRFDHKRGRWLIWRDHWWAEDTDGEVLRLAKKAVRERYHRLVNIAELKRRESAAKFAIRSEDRARLDALLHLARAEKPLADDGEGWDADPWLLGVANGVVDLRTGILRAGKLEDRMTMHVADAFDPSAPCSRWLQFLQEVFEKNVDLIDFIHRAMGYSLTGDTSEQSIYFCFGRGANGKGRFFEALRHVLGPYAYDAPFSTFEASARTTIPNDLAALCGRRFVTASETAENTRLNEARLKALSGCDPLTARFLNHEFFTFTPMCKLWLAVNHKPRVTDDSLGFWRRVKLIPFTRTFEGVADDKHLDEKLHAEAQGILAWAVRGALEWQKRGLEPPKTVQAATDEYRRESDPLAEFVATKCIRGERFRAPVTDLYKAYAWWASAAGLRDRDTLSIQAFGRRMAEEFKREHMRTGTEYVGIGLAAVTDTASGNPSKIKAVTIPRPFPHSSPEKIPV